MVFLCKCIETLYVLHYMYYSVIHIVFLYVCIETLYTTLYTCVYVQICVCIDPLYATLYAYTYPPARTRSRDSKRAAPMDSQFSKVSSLPFTNEIRLQIFGSRDLSVFLIDLSSDRDSVYTRENLYKKFGDSRETVFDMLV